MTLLTQAVCEHSGKPSTSRMMAVFAVVVILGVWAEVSVRRNELQALSAEQVAMVLGAMGVKAWQRGKESSKDQAPTSREIPIAKQQIERRE